MTTAGVKTVVSNSKALLVLQLANYVLPFLIIPVLTRALGLSLYGIVAFGLALVQIACIITDFGFNLSATRSIASANANPVKVRKIIGGIFACKLLLLVPAIFFIALVIGFQSDRYGDFSLFFFILIFSVVGQTFQPLWFFQGIEKMKIITVSLVLSRIAYLIMVLMLVAAPDDYVWVAVANGISQIFAACLTLFFMCRFGYFPLWNGWRYAKVLFLGSLEFFWSRAAVATYTAGGVFFLGLTSNPVSVAIYSSAEQLYKGAQALVQPVAQAMYPYMARTKNLSLLFRVMKYASALSALCAVAAIFTGEWFLKMIFGPDFVAAYPILMVFMLTFLVVVPSILLGYPFLSALGDSRSANLSVIFGGGVQIIALVVLYFGGLHTPLLVAGSVFITESFVLTYRVWRGRRLVEQYSNK